MIANMDADAHLSVFGPDDMRSFLSAYGATRDQTPVVEKQYRRRPARCLDILLCGMKWKRPSRAQKCCEQEILHVE